MIRTSFHVSAMAATLSLMTVMPKVTEAVHNQNAFKDFEDLYASMVQSSSQQIKSDLAQISAEFKMPDVNGQAAKAEAKANKATGADKKKEGGGEDEKKKKEEEKKKMMDEQMKKKSGADLESAKSSSEGEDETDSDIDCPPQNPFAK